MLCGNKCCMKHFAGSWLSSTVWDSSRRVTCIISCHVSRGATYAPRSLDTCVYSSVHVMAPPCEVRTASEETNHRAAHAAATRQRRPQQTAVQRGAQAAALCRRWADSSVRSHENDAKRLCQEDPLVHAAKNGAPMEPLLQLTLRLLGVPRRPLTFLVESAWGEPVP